MNIRNEKVNHATDAKRIIKKSLASSCHWDKSIEVNPYKWGKLIFLTKVQRHLNRGQFSQEMILGQLDIYTQIIGTWPKSHTLYKTLNSVSKWIIYSNVKL